MAPLKKVFQEDTTLIERKSLKKEIFDVIHTRIISGKYSPGEWLRQEEISTQLGVSQTPVREALDLLVSTGLADRIPYRGVRVLQLTTDEIIEAYAIRLLLESTAASASAINRTNEDLKVLMDLVNQTEELMSLSDMSTQMQINREFHHVIVASSGISLMTRLYEVVSHQFPDWMLYEYMFRHPELLHSSLTTEFHEHKLILAAISDQKPEQAAEYVIIHIKNLGNELVEFLGIPGDLLAKKEKQIMAIPQYMWDKQFLEHLL